MRHANNAVYVDWLEETLIAAGLGSAIETIPRSYGLEYLAAAALGARLEARAWREEDATIRFRVVNADGRDVLRAAVGGRPVAGA